MGKLIFLLIIIAIIYYFFKKSQISTINNKSSDENEFVQCEKCKTFILKKEAIKKNEKYYCKECYANT
jgi:uncharacterized protein